MIIIHKGYWSLIYSESNQSVIYEVYVFSATNAIFIRVSEFTLKLLRKNVVVIPKKKKKEEQIKQLIF